MNMNSFSSLWDQVLDIIKNEISEISYLTWFKSIESVSIDSGRVVLCAPSVFNKGILEARYQKILNEAFYAITSQEYIIDITVKADTYTNSCSPEILRYDGSGLRPEFTFDNFIVGECNRIAVKAATEVAYNQAAKYNPLYIYGGVGTGKTHLIQAIGNYFVSHNEAGVALFMMIDEFMNDLINHIKDDRQFKFKLRFENIDMLIIDDLQFIEGKERTQEELCRVLNSLIGKGRQVILAANKPPESITVLNERFTSQFELGAAIRLENPDLNTKREVLKQHAEMNGIALCNDVVEYLTAIHYEGLRELKGFLNRLCALSLLSNQEISVAMIKQMIHDNME